jgi:hypothetical protein
LNTEPEETQVSSAESFPDLTIQNVQARQLKALEDEMTVANEEYIRAVNRASRSYSIGFDVPIHHGRA